MKKSTKAVKASTIKLTKNGKRMGRPPKVVVQNNALNDALKTMLDLVSKHKDLFISFDSKRYLVEFMWKDDVYQVPPQEVNNLLSAMKYLEDRELKWVTN